MPLGAVQAYKTRFSHCQVHPRSSETVKFVLHSSEITSHSRGNLPFKRIVFKQDEPPTSSRLLLLLLQNLVFTIFFFPYILTPYFQRESVLSRQEHLDPRVWHALLLGRPCDLRRLRQPRTSYHEYHTGIDTEAEGEDIGYQSRCSGYHIGSCHCSQAAYG